jgi:cysteine desulfurase/selenocysteine lyase
MLYLPGEFPQDPALCYLNHAAIGPWPKRTAQAAARFAEQSVTRGGADYPQWLKVEQRLRERVARLINAPSPDDIALLKNTSEGLSIVSQGLDWQPGDEVVGLGGDFCSNHMVWEALRDREVVYRPIEALETDDPEGALIAALRERTRLLAISTVHFATGYRFDIARLAEACRAHGALLSVDAIQSLGAVPFDLAATPADFVTCGSHKWLLAPEGVGILYCRPDLRERLRLHQFGWAMRESPYAFEDRAWHPAHTARRFECGTPNMLGIHALEASLSLFDEVGMDVVERRLAQNLQRLETGLRQLPGVEVVTPAQPVRRAGILTFRHARIDGQALYTGLMESGIVCSARAGGVRLAPHFYTPEDRLDAAVSRVEDLVHNLR